MDNRYNIRLTEAAKAAGLALAEEGKGIRFSIVRSGCCSMAVSLYPDVEKSSDQVITIDGVPILTGNEYPEMHWSGLIGYKPKGLHKGFHWKNI